MFLTSLILIVFAVCQSKTSEIKCERIFPYHNYKKCCYFDKTTKINSINFTIDIQEIPEIDAILFDNNKNVVFLPVNVYKKFPYLKYYHAKNASVKKISALNFEGLSSVKLLNLESNQIEFIPNYCFEALTKLNEISLSIKMLIFDC